MNTSIYIFLCRCIHTHTYLCRHVYKNLCLCIFLHTVNIKKDYKEYGIEHEAEWLAIPLFTWEFPALTHLLSDALSGNGIFFLTAWWQFYSFLYPLTHRVPPRAPLQVLWWLWIGKAWLIAQTTLLVKKPEQSTLE